MLIRDRPLQYFVTLATLTLIAVVLYWGKPVLMPVAMAVLLTFLLNPAVTALRRCHVWHGVAVTLVVVMTFSVLGLVLFLIGKQFNTLAYELPRYEDNIRSKISELRLAFRNGALDETREMVREIQGELSSSNEAVGPIVEPDSSASPSTDESSSDSSDKPAEKQVATVVPEKGAFSQLLDPVSHALITAGLVIALVVFMLLRRDELRNRLILLGGLHRLPLATRILREAGRRITRYLLTYGLLNSLYGVVVGAGLFLIGLPYALMWGCLAAALRFIPYVGPWLGALLPVGLSLAVFPGWLLPLFVAMLYIVAELTTNLLLEPIFYGQSARVSEVALLVALAFWTWIWGPIGLLLGTPLTVCLVVLAKYVPVLEPVHLLLGDGPVSEKCLIYYERLCSGNVTEADILVRDEIDGSPPDGVFNDLLLPALILAKHDLERGELRSETEERILNHVRASIELVGPPSTPIQSDAGEAPKYAAVTAVAIPAGNQFEELAFLMLRRLLQGDGVALDILPPDDAGEDSAGAVLRIRPDIVCVGATPPGSGDRVSRVTGSLREAGYKGAIVANRWGINRHWDRRLRRALGRHYSGEELSASRALILEILNELMERSDDAPRIAPRHRPHRDATSSQTSA